MTVLSVGIDEGRSNLPKLAALAHAGRSSLLTKHGKPYAAIVSADVLLKAHASRVCWRCAALGAGYGASR
ncbi:MAG: type II toxin-antitoxin system Phd/YefM family antitoxin [Rhodoferax sp.]|nr:type II toxin-antitoxin system Phd/YefM family antitoxin [Rhodoferax sp.]